jgi:MATE family multidrug resistance protein
MMSDINLVRSLSLDYSIWMIILPFFASFCYQFDGIFIGASQTKEIRNAMFFSVSMYLVISLIMTNYFSNNGVWISLTLFMILRALSLYYYLNRIYLKFSDS